MFFSHISCVLEIGLDSKVLCLGTGAYQKVSVLCLFVKLGQWAK